MSAQEEGAKEQDKYLPIANIARIMKKALPPNAKVAKDAKETVQECVSEFISFITSEVRTWKGGGRARRRKKRSVRRRPSFFFFFVSFSFFSFRSTSPLSLFLLSLPLLLELTRRSIQNKPKTSTKTKKNEQKKLNKASDKCQREKRKTINGDDLLWALSTLGFECYVDPLKAYLAKYRESEKNAMAAGGGGKGGDDEGAGPSADGGDTD